MEELKTLMFKIGEEYYGVNIKDVQGIENVKGFTKVPNTADYIKGIINLRGDIIPVYSLRKKFGMEDLNREELSLIIVTIGGMRIALEIDVIDAIQDIDSSMIFDVPTIIKTPDEQYYEKVLNVNDKIVVVLNAEKLLSVDEKETISKLVSEN